MPRNKPEMCKTTVYGIKNCDTMRKAFQWLDEHKIAYSFHDYKKSGVDADVLEQAIKELGWETVINRKGATWRGLPDSVRDSMNATKALETARENPSVVKRPLLVHGETMHLGFDAQSYKEIFAEHL